MSGFDYIDQNLSLVRAEIAEKEAAVGRTHKTLMLAAIKYGTDDEVRALLSGGVRDVGENRVQQLLDRWELLLAHQTRVHFIGSLQTNKVKYIIDKVCMIHSLDSLKLAAEIDRQAKKHGRIMDVLVEINSGEEENKSGVMPADAEQLCSELGAFENIRLRGFMTMAPKCEKKEEYLKYFQQTYAEVLDIWTKKLHNIDRPIISMGMSESFPEAIACGSDIVRIGRSLFVK